jgi:molybdate transport repressor ModE-like protein
MRKQNFASVPTEIMRSVVEIAEEGSISKAARSLGISQPAISAQLKRIEEYVGGNIFHKSAHGSALTELGKVVLIQARKILEANQQLKLLRGTGSPQLAPRVGITDLYASRAFTELAVADFTEVSIVADNSTEIIKGLVNGFIDIGMFLQPKSTTLDPSIVVLRERPEDLIWVRSPDFVLSPGAPIPLLTWSGKITHNLMIHTLEKCGLIYRIAFSGPDHHAHLEAARRGLGITALPKRLIPSNLVQAKEYYLPPLTAPTLYLGERAGLDLNGNKFLNSLVNDFFSPA